LKRIGAITFMFFLFAAALSAEDLDPTALIGMELKSAFDTFGPPDEVFPYRGAEDWQDNVVFFYSNYTYLFWFKNRVWQVRCDRRFGGALLGLIMGLDRESVKNRLDRSIREQGDSFYFDMDEGKYPLRVRLVFNAGSLSDVYVYRSDF
jgi:hypothetical protein